jgi:hypothetical protein
MGKSAKLTRGGNKKRQNIGRQQAKLKAQGAKNHVQDKSAKKEAVASPKFSSRKSKSSTLKSLASQPNSAVKMAPKPSTTEEQ